MRVLILGGDGYLGWPTAMHMAKLGHEVMVIDNYLRRDIARQTSSEALMPTPNLQKRADIYAAETGFSIKVEIGDCCDMRFMEGIFKDFQPESLVHYAEQPSAPYSMMGYNEASLTFDNNLKATFNVIWAVSEFAPKCHIVKLGTMGEYGCPNIDIEEGWIDVEHKGRKQKFLYPRQAGSLYHTTKVLDTDLLWFYVRTYGLAVTDLMQGPVYGFVTPETQIHDSLLPNFHYDDIFGTLVNRFLVQAVAGVPLTVYGQGGQTRGYLNLNDTLQCVQLAVEKPTAAGDLRILNQFTETFSVNDFADRVVSVGNQMGLDVEKKSIINPRKEPEDHYYNPMHSGLIDLGLKPTLLSDDVLGEMLTKVIQYKDLIQTDMIMPRVRWDDK